MWNCRKPVANGLEDSRFKLKEGRGQVNILNSNWNFDCSKKYSDTYNMYENHSDFPEGQYIYIMDNEGGNWQISRDFS